MLILISRFCPLYSQQLLSCAVLFIVGIWTLILQVTICDVVLSLPSPIVFIRNAAKKAGRIWFGQGI